MEVLSFEEDVNLIQKNIIKSMKLSTNKEKKTFSFDYLTDDLDCFNWTKKTLNKILTETKKALRAQ